MANNRVTSRTALAVLKVLHEHTDEEHPMKPSELAYLVSKALCLDSDSEVDLRAIDRHARHLHDMGYPVVAIDRNNNTINDWDKLDKSRRYFMSSDFGKEEIRFLIDSVLCSKVLTKTNKKDLIVKLKALVSKHQSKSFDYTENVSTQQNGDNISTIYSISTVNDAIEQKKQIEFRYVSYRPNSRMEPQLEPRSDRVYTASVYHMLIHNNKFYAVCNIEGYKNMSYYKLDKMTDVRILEEVPARPLGDIDGWSDKMKVEENLPHFVYMYDDKPVPITLRAPISIMDQLVDWLGTRAVYKMEKDGNVEVTLTTSPTAMKYWALQYGEAVEILEPASLRDEIRKSAQAIAKKYSKTKNEPIHEK